ncbi:MAG: hypothetical protein RL329_1537 [Bacteroidota bacterium]|jgi:hypothetical protein
MIQNYFKYKLLVISLIAITACQKWDIYGVDTSGMGAEYAIPILEGKTSLQEVLRPFDQRAFFEIAPDGLMTLYYKGQIQARSSLDIFNSIQQQLIVPIPLQDSVTQIPVKPPTGVQVTKTLIKTGELTALCWLPSQFTEVLDITIYAPQLKKNGQAFSRTFTAYPNSPIPSLNRYDISGYNLVAQNDSIFLIYDARKRSNNERVVIPLNTSTGRGIAIQLNNLVFSYAEGWLGQSPFQTDRDTIDIDFFDNWKIGEVKFVNPSVDITLDNSFGFPVQAIARAANVITIDNQTLALRSNILNNLVVNYPTLQEIGQIKRTVIHFDKNNSNIDSIINSNPAKFDYWIEGLTNPDTSRRVIGFLTDSSFFKLQVEVRLPVWGTAKNFEVTQEYPLQLSNYDKVDYVEFKLNTQNEMPIGVGLQGYFRTENKTIVDSLYVSAKSILAGAPVDAAGNVTGASKQTAFIKMDAAKFAKVRNCTNMALKYNFATTGNATIPVKVRSQQQVKVQIGMKVGLK